MNSTRNLDLAATTLDASREALRSDVRDFLNTSAAVASEPPAMGPGGRADFQFSRQLGARGWLGMSVPTELGGGGRTAVERFVVNEELLAAGAPVAAHWVADRQTTACLLSFGTDEQCRRFLPRIVAGELYFSIGMSEPDAGSDLAAVRTSATQVDGGWSLNGTKVWTSGAHRNHLLFVLCRTSASDELAVAAAKITADRSASIVTANAHQVHGAIGVTREYDLQLVTRRRMSWRDEFGTGRLWSKRLGRSLVAGGAAALWPSITSGFGEPSVTQDGRADCL